MLIKLTYPMFFIKYILRVCHIGSIIALSHKVITDYSNGFISSDHSLLYATLGVVCMVSGIMLVIVGLANTFILQPKKMGEKRKLWIGYHHAKLLITLILFTPLGNIFGEGLANLRMYWVLSIIFVSPYMRFYRERYTNSIEKI